jgi:hypothetical protein
MGSFKSDIQATRSEAAAGNRDRRTTNSITRNYYCIRWWWSWKIKLTTSADWNNFIYWRCTIRRCY